MTVKCQSICAAVVASLFLSPAVRAQNGFQSIVPGEVIPIRTDEAIDATKADGRIFTGRVDSDVRDSNGVVAIPAGSTVELTARAVSGNTLALDLESVTVDGQRYAVRASTERGTSGQTLGANRKTAEYVGGGALLGTILGAVIGGGKGAAIGAATGAAAGAGTQIVTNGRWLSVPRGAVVTFQLDRALDIGVPDIGTMRNGRHYHPR